MYCRTMAGRPHAREFLVDPATVKTNNAIIGERLTLVRLIRGIGKDDIQILEWLARHGLMAKDCSDHVKKTDHARAYISVYNYNTIYYNYVIASEKMCHVDNYFKIILFGIIIEHLLIYRALFYFI